MVFFRWLGQVIEKRLFTCSSKVGVNNDNYSSVVERANSNALYTHGNLSLALDETYTHWVTILGSYQAPTSFTSLILGYMSQNVSFQLYFILILLVCRRGRAEACLDSLCVL
ncbi:hypothetical protein O6H91_01G100000 [Diphasiastrum complanatum]|uniref:Uncharacterized protein n=1 Tax=Diphasiastrum complanatum TaxID=34168 RepID=A0ACC2ETW7_DIPCM|nr:hypothetical protein O6H91_01G100000 [Diphasiastrum complanatum]